MEVIAKHTKKAKKKANNVVTRTLARHKVSNEVRRARSKMNEEAKGVDLEKKFGKDHSINKPISPGVRARVRNMAEHGEEVPSRTKGKIDTSLDPIKRLRVAGAKLVNRGQARERKRAKAAVKARKKNGK